MIATSAFEELIIFPTLALKQLTCDLPESSKNLSVEFKLGVDSITGILILDGFNLNFQERMDLLSIFSESINIFLGKMLSKENSSLALSAPKLINLDRDINIIDNETWYKFSLVFEEISYPVVIYRKGFL